MSNTPIRMETVNQVCHITIDRQDKLNALNRAMIGELDQAFEQAANEASVRVVVLTGAGPKAFIAGADIAELQGLDAAGAAAASRQGQALTRRIQHRGKPVIAAVNGFALGGGCEMALACTLRIASSNAMLGLPEIKLGVLAGYGGTQRLSRLIPRGLAMEMALTGDPIDAHTAAEWGLVNRLFDDNETLLDGAMAIADRLASGPRSLALIRQAYWNTWHNAFEQQLDLEARLQNQAGASKDFAEGVAAFLEKRDAQFTGE